MEHKKVAFSWATEIARFSNIIIAFEVEASNDGLVVGSRRRLSVVVFACHASSERVKVEIVHKGARLLWRRSDRLVLNGSGNNHVLDDGRRMRGCRLCGP